MQSTSSSFEPNAVSQQHELLTTYRRRLHFNLQQQATLGVTKTPFDLFIDINQCREMIRQITVNLQQMGAEVELNPDDSSTEGTELAPSLPEQVRDGLVALGELMRSQAVRDIVSAFAAEFQDARMHINILKAYKEIHNLLHGLQFKFPQIEEAAEKITRNKTGNLLAKWIEMEAYEQDLQIVINDTQAVARLEGAIAHELVWVQELVHARNYLRGAIEQRNREPVISALLIIRPIIMYQPTKINKGLYDAARDIRQHALLERLKQIRDRISHPNIDQQKLRRISDGIDALTVLNTQLGLLIINHNSWQDVDNQLRSIRDSPRTKNTAELKILWPHIKRQIDPLCKHDSDILIRLLKDEGHKLDDAISLEDSSKIRDCFRNYLSHASLRFYRLDQTLMKHCGALRETVGEQLAYLKGQIE